MCMIMYGKFVSLFMLLGANLGNGTGRQTATMVAPLPLTSFLARYKAVLHGCGTNLMGVGVEGVVYILVTPNVTP